MALFGWCLDSHHEDCMVKISDNNRCGCVCHSNSEMDTTNMPVVKGNK